MYQVHDTLSLPGYIYLSSAGDIALISLEVLNIRDMLKQLEEIGAKISLKMDL